MNDKAFIDTNIFIYLYSEDEIHKRKNIAKCFCAEEEVILLG